jgi:Mg2+ and Co2+ transporter CorA
LLLYSDRLVEALRRLNIGDPDNVRAFKREIRSAFEGFLRFTHRYWFHEVSEQAQARALYGLLHQHLQVQPLYTEVKTRIADMAQYLETDSIRRQANTVVRLTVVTIFGLVGTITTGFLGMNLLSESDAPLGYRLAVFGLTLLVTCAITVVTIVKSKRLSDFLDALSDERLTPMDKLKSLASVWRH